MTNEDNTTHVPISNLDIGDGNQAGSALRVLANYQERCSACRAHSQAVAAAVRRRREDWLGDGCETRGSPPCFVNTGKV